MSVLIAGGDGFIGTNLRKLFRKQGIPHDVADLKINIDICDVDGSRYDVIVLLAANLNQDMQMFKDNLRIYKWAAQQTAHIIYTSSAAVYGDSAVAHTENEPTPAPTLYGRSKLIGEQLISQGCQRRTILRLANVYGEGDGNGVIDIFKRGGNQIYGTGEDIRDYVSVNVVCETIKEIVLNPGKYNKEIFNVSSSKPMTTTAAYAQYGKPGQEPEYLPARAFDVKCSILNNAKASRAGLL